MHTCVSSTQRCIALLCFFTFFFSCANLSFCLCSIANGHNVLPSSFYSPLFYHFIFPSSFSHSSHAPFCSCLSLPLLYFIHVPPPIHCLDPGSFLFYIPFIITCLLYYTLLDISRLLVYLHPLLSFRFFYCRNHASSPFLPYVYSHFINYLASSPLSPSLSHLLSLPCLFTPPSLPFISSAPSYQLQLSSTKAMCPASHYEHLNSLPCPYICIPFHSCLFHFLLVSIAFLSYRILSCPTLPYPTDGYKTE